MVEVERRVSGEIDTHRARRDLSMLARPRTSAGPAAGSSGGVGRRPRAGYALAETVWERSGNSGLTSKLHSPCRQGESKGNEPSLYALAERVRQLSERERHVISQ